MTRPRIALLAVLLLLFSGILIFSQTTGTASPQTTGPSAEPPRARVAIYHVAPGKHLDFLRWEANRETAAREAGQPRAQYYAHTDGANWDYIQIVPQVPNQEELDKKIQAAYRSRGMAPGLAGGLEFRQFMADHTDTFAIGPLSIEDLIREEQKK
jgi:hypothetical protein